MKGEEQEDVRGGEQAVLPRRVSRKNSSVKKQVRFPSNSTRRSTSATGSGRNSSLLMKEEQAAMVDEKVAAATRQAKAAKKASSENPAAAASPSYDEQRWELLVAKQEEIMKDHNDSTSNRPPRKRASSTNSHNKIRRTYSSASGSNRKAKPTKKAPVRAKSSPSPYSPSSNNSNNDVLVSGDAPNDDDAASLQSPIPLPTTLTPNTNIQEEIMPGAFRMRPTMGATPAQGLAEGERDDREVSRRSVVSQKSAQDILIEATLVAEDNEVPTSSSNNDTTTTRRPSDTQQQTPPNVVVPEPELVMGHPMDPRQMEKLDAAAYKERDRLRSIVLGLVCCFVTFLIVLGVVLGVTLLGSKQETPTHEQKVQPQSQQGPTVEAAQYVEFVDPATIMTSPPLDTVIPPATNPPVPAATLPPSPPQTGATPPLAAATPPQDAADNEVVEASESPTMAPTGFVQDMLPLDTQEAIQNDPNSPQARAFDWVQKDLEAYYSKDTTNTVAYFALQRFVLATFYYALGGPQWTQREGWLQEGTDPCGWYTPFYGSVCTTAWNRHRYLRQRTLLQGQERRYLQRLSLFNNNLVGTLPPELGLLSMLDVVNLHDNRISSTIPTEVGLWKHVTFLQLFNNSLTGTVPTELAELNRVWHLNLAFNQLSGTIPAELSRLSTDLAVLSISNNMLSGPVIPTEFGRFTELVGLHLYRNPNLSGQLPTELGLMKKLKRLQMNAIPNLNGTLPSEIGVMSDLEEVFLQETALQGQIPSSLGSLTKLTKLALHNTKLSGTVPLEVCNLVNTGILKDLSVDCIHVRCKDCDCDCTSSTRTDGTGNTAMSTPGSPAMEAQQLATTTDPPPTEAAAQELITDAPIRVVAEVNSP